MDSINAIKIFQADDRPITKKDLLKGRLIVGGGYAVGLILVGALGQVNMAPLGGVAGMAVAFCTWALKYKRKRNTEGVK